MTTNDSLKKKLTAETIITTLLLIGIIVFAVLRTDALSKRIDALSSNLASTTATLQTDIAASQSLAINISQNSATDIKQQVGAVQSQVGSLSGTVGTLQKLSQTDPQLLEKYSKIYFLNENYAPASLTQIPAAYTYSDTKPLLLLTQALPHMQAMVDAASSTGVQFYAFSAYRSFSDQQELKGEYTVTYGAGTANSFSADQGYSEHQLGTAIDFISPGQGGVLDGFDNTPAYPWLLANAYKYGFELSYPKGNSYYVFEPWHWRFVGVKLATDLHNEGKNFYDLDQRTIDTYLVNIFD